jgi:hypothetical protein
MSSLMETLGRGHLVEPDYLVLVEREIHCLRILCGLEEWNQICASPEAGYSPKSARVCPR